MNIYLCGETEPFKGEVVLDRGEDSRVAKLRLECPIIEEYMGDFAIRLFNEDISRVEGLNGVRITDIRTVVQ